jgi:hypothetical protein
MAPSADDGWPDYPAAERSPAGEQAGRFFFGRMIHFRMSQNLKDRTAASRVLGAKAFAAMSAVEGLRLPPSSKMRLADMEERKLSSAQKRAEVLRAYASGKHR